jgi:hypothetical protein
MVVRTPIIPCSKVVEWIISHTNLKHRKILNDEGRCIGFLFGFRGGEVLQTTSTRKAYDYRICGTFPRNMI